MVKPSLCAFLFACFLLPALAAPPSRNNPLSNVGVTGHGMSGSQPDPKRPGKFLWKFTARDFGGNLLDNGQQGYLIDADVTMYEKGVPSTRMRAPRAQASNATKTVVATGRVLISSLTQKGTVLNADRVIWYAATNKVLAVGHVFYRDGKTGATFEVPSLIADTKLRTIRSPGPGSGQVFPKGF